MVEVWWIDRFNHEAFPENKNRPKPDWAKEFVPKVDYDLAIDILRRHQLEYLLGGTSDGDRASNTGAGVEALIKPARSSGDW